MYSIKNLYSKKKKKKEAACSYWPRIGHSGYQGYLKQEDKTLGYSSQWCTGVPKVQMYSIKNLNSIKEAACSFLTLDGNLPQWAPRVPKKEDKNLSIILVHSGT